VPEVAEAEAVLVDLLQTEVEIMEVPEVMVFSVAQMVF
jgi:hypothetical protein